MSVRMRFLGNLHTFLFLRSVPALIMVYHEEHGPKAQFYTLYVSPSRPDPAGL
jgi:hypothetical protein